MRNTLHKIIIILLFSGLFAQEDSPKVQSLKQEWKEHASHQRKELIGFINFLYDQQFYDRARLAYFEFLFKLPEDPLKASAYYYIADCYEKEGQQDLALKYYEQSINEADSGSVAHHAASIRKMHIILNNGDYDRILEMTADADDPYYLLYRGYAHMHQLDFINARLAFKAAEERFDHKAYSRRISPILKALDIVDNLEAKSKTRTILAGIVPGGSRAYLKGWHSAAGVAVSTAIMTGLALRTIETNSGDLGFREPVQNWVPSGSEYAEKSSSNKRLISKSVNLSGTSKTILLPAIGVGLGVYFGSIWGAVNDIHAQNVRLKERAVLKVSSRYPPDKFQDYPQPVFN